MNLDADIGLGQNGDIGWRNEEKEELAVVDGEPVFCKALNTQKFTNGASGFLFFQSGSPPLIFLLL